MQISYEMVSNAHVRQLSDCVPLPNEECSSPVVQLLGSISTTVSLNAESFSDKRTGNRTSSAIGFLLTYPVSLMPVH